MNSDETKNRKTKHRIRKIILKVFIREIRVNPR